VTTHAVNADVDEELLLMGLGRGRSKDNESEVGRCRGIGGCRKMLCYFPFPRLVRIDHQRNEPATRKE